MIISFVGGDWRVLRRFVSRIRCDVMQGSSVLAARDTCLHGEGIKLISFPESPMRTVNLHYAKAHFFRIVDQAGASAESSMRQAACIERQAVRKAECDARLGRSLR